MLLHCYCIATCVGNKFKMMYGLFYVLFIYILLNLTTRVVLYLHSF